MELKRKKGSEGSNQIIYSFIVLADNEAIKKLSTIAFSRELEELTHEEIIRIIKKIFDKKNSFFSERTKPIETRQDPNESTM